MSVDWFAASRGRQFAVRAWALHLVVTISVAVAGSVWVAAAAEAKGPGRTYCFLKKCHRVKTIAETQALVGRDMTVVASHYDSCKKDRFNPCGLTSSGEPFFPERADNAASPVLPDGTVVMVWSKATKQAVVLRINNAGPYWGNRKLDLSRAAARTLGIAGVGEVTLRVLTAPTPAEARYVKNRRYAAVPGPIGQFASLDAAQGAAAVMLAQGSAPALTVADLAIPAKRDASADLSSAFKSPMLPGFAIPKGALADALIAQSTMERRVVATAMPTPVNVPVFEKVPSTVRAVTPKLTAARVVAPRRTRVRAMEVRPVASDPLTAIANALIDFVDPPKVNKRARAAKPVRNVTVARVVSKAVPKAAPKAIASVNAKRVARVAMARTVEPGEYRAGHTTYAEDRYRKPATGAGPSAAKTKTKTKVAKLKSKSGPAAVAAGTASKASKQAGVVRGKPSAALRKAGGWQSSAVFDVPFTRPELTGSPPRIPARDLKDDTEAPPRAPVRRVQPSTLV